MLIIRSKATYISVYYWHPLRQIWIESYRVREYFLTFTIKKEREFWQSLGFATCISWRTI